MILSRILVAVTAASLTVAQMSSSYTDSGITFQGITGPSTSLQIGFVTPNSGDADEFVGEIVASSPAQWAGIALGGQMAYDLLLVAWPNDGEIVFSSRYTTGYTQPTEYDGPTITTLSQSSVDSDTWRWVFRCQNCTSWASSTGSTTTLDLTGTDVVAAVVGLTPVDDPSDPQSTFAEHDSFDIWGEAFGDSTSSDYDSIASSSA